MAIAFAGFTAPYAHAVDYTINPAGSPLDWNTDASWTPLTPGVYPGSTIGVTDIALVTGDFGAAAKIVDISATPVEGLSRLFIGNSNAAPQTTTIRTSNASSLLLSPTTTTYLSSNNATVFSCAVITSAGTAGAVNVISAPVILTGTTANLVIGPQFDANPPTAETTANTNGLTFSGKITPSVAGSRTIVNQTSNTVTFGDIDISTGTGVGTLTIENTANPLKTADAVNTYTKVSGVIANGNTAGGNSSVAYAARVAGTTFEISGANTYTGNTVLSPNIGSNQYTFPSTFKINSDTAFGVGGTLTTGGSGGAAVNILEALNADRSFTHNVTLTRAVTFQGSFGLTFSGNISQTSTQTLTNNITAPGKKVVLGSITGNNNPNDNGRIHAVTGAGTTVFSGSIRDCTLVAPATAVNLDSVGQLRNTGTGTVVITGSSKLQGGHIITAGGTFQLGDGVTAGEMAPDNVGVPSIVSSVSGGSFAINAPSETTVNAIANGPLGIKQLGGKGTLTATQFNGGANAIGDGVIATTLVVTAGPTASTSATADIAATIVPLPGAPKTRTVTLKGGATVTSLGLKAGQPIYLTSGSPSSTSWIQRIVDDTNVIIFGNNGSMLATGTDVGASFGEGSALGTGTATTAVNNLGTLAGTGTISGAVTGLTGSRIAPGVNTAGNFGVAGTLTTGALTLENGAKLDFDIAATAAGTGDLIATNNQNVTLGSANFVFSSLTAGTLQTGVPYPLINAGTGIITGDAGTITTTLTGGLAGLYTAAYSVTGGVLSVTFSPGGGGGGFAGWAATNAPGQTANQDYDNDGVQNGVEYFMGKTGSSFTATPGPDSTGKIVWPKDPAFSGTYMIQISGTLLPNGWTDVPVNGTNPKDNGTSVEYTPPTGQGKLFVRLRVIPD